MMFEQVALAVAALWAFAAAVVAGVAITRRRAMSAPTDAGLPERVALIRPCAGPGKSWYNHGISGSCDPPALLAAWRREGR